MKTIIVNGANGYVASNFINNLLKQKYKVIALVRANKGLSPEERMEKVLVDIKDNENVDTTNLQVYGYSLLDDNFSIEENDLKTIFHTDVDYFHFAASLKYDEKSVGEIFSTNVEGVKNSVKVFSKYATTASRFFYIGTAYSCGKHNGVFEEKFYNDEDILAFRNYYEQSKRFAENIINENIRKNGLKGHIIRLSQVVGNKQTGVTKTDYGIFDFSKRMYNLAKRYPNTTVRVRVFPEATQNLIAIDTVLSYLMKTVEVEQLPVIMNFVAKNSTKNKHIIDGLNKLLPINIIPLEKLDKKEMNSMERLISVGMSFTGSYVNTNIKFDTKRRDEFIASSNGEIDKNTIFKMLEYFIDSLSENKKKQKSNAA
jgi:nucleoside-diphosphate-sugar epimerase